LVGWFARSINVHVVHRHEMTLLRGSLIQLLGELNVLLASKTELQSVSCDELRLPIASGTDVGHGE